MLDWFARKVLYFKMYIWQRLIIPGKARQREDDIIQYPSITWLQHWANLQKAIEQEYTTLMLNIIMC